MGLVIGQNTILVINLTPILIYKKQEMTQKEKEEEKHLRQNPINVFQCGKCKDAKQLVYEEFKKHLQKEHGINTEDRNQLKGTKQMTMHMDGSYWYSSNYEWKLESGLVFHQTCRNARVKGDPMRYEY